LPQLTNHLEANIKREIAQLYKSYFGKGPDKTLVKIYENVVHIKVEGALSQIEESLMQSIEGEGLVDKIRDEMLLKQTSNYVPTVEKILNLKVDKVSYLMGEKNKTMHMFLLLADNIEIE
jgi:uncharacterized protein YbcI